MCMCLCVSGVFFDNARLQFDSASFIFLLQISGGGGGNTFRRSTK